jgi:putative protease
MSRAGISRVVLARELGIEEIREIKARTSCELEVFVHGALCVSESGLCLFSSFLGGKSANRGMCAQACRRLYSAEVSGGTRQGYFFSPHDLQLVDRIPDLVQAGVHSFKIEGRMKSAEYVGTVVSAYRYMLDHWEEDRKGATETARRILANDFARAKTRYWFDSSKAENFLNPEQAGGTGIFLGKIDRVKTEEDGRFALLKGGSYDPDAGDSVRLHKKDDSGRESHKIKEIRDEGGSRWVDVPEGFGTGDSVYLLQTKAMSKRYPRVLPGDLAAYRSQPGGEKLPELKLEIPAETDRGSASVPAASPAPGVKMRRDDKTRSESSRHDIDDFPEGVYVQVSTIEDLFAILTDRPVRAILELNKTTSAALLGTGEGSQSAPVVLPFPKREIFLSLDPFLPQGAEDGLASTLDSLVENGYTHFIVNNPGHIGMLRNRGLKLIAGPYLYAFNRWSADWLFRQGLSSQITPLENSRENLEASFDPSFRNRVMITVFAYPALFRMRFKLPADYNFTFFNDRQGGTFKALSTDDGSFVMPEMPFSITDKVTAIRKTGFSRFLIDLSRTKVVKSEYRLLMESYRKGTSLPEVSRFNWKDGFYDPDKMEEFKQMTERANFRKAGAQNSAGKKPAGGRSDRNAGAHSAKPRGSSHAPAGRTGAKAGTPRKPSGKGRGRKGE